MNAPDDSYTDWARCFVARLLQLRPSLTETEASEVALVAFETASDIEPHDAAEVFGGVLDAKVPIHDLRRWVSKIQDRRF
jgi:hypothetical protein